MTVVLLPRQTPSGGLDEVRSTLSSWDRCMSRAYCKWPVIAALISAGLIALIVLWCIVGCLCFGTACCCGCCGCCRSCGGGGRRRRNNRPKDIEPHPPPVFGNGYHAPAPFSSPHTPGNPAQPGPVNGDSLPPMPTWQTAQETRVLEERKAQGADVELNHLHPSPPVTPELNQHMQSQGMPHSPPVYQPDPYSYNGGSAGPQPVGYQPTPTSPYHHQQQHQQQLDGYGTGRTYDSAYDPVSPVSPSVYSYPTYTDQHQNQQPQGYSYSESRQAPVTPATAGARRVPPPVPGTAGAGSSYAYQGPTSPHARSALPWADQRQAPKPRYMGASGDYAGGDGGGGAVV